MSHMIPYIHTPNLIKKDEVYSYVTKHKTVVSMLFFSSAGVCLFLKYALADRVVNMFVAFDRPVPFFTQHFPLVLTILTVICASIGVYVLMTEPNHAKIQAIVENTKDSDMIDVRLLANAKYIGLLLFLLGLMVGYLVLSVVQPIYSLTVRI